MSINHRTLSVMIGNDTSTGPATKAAMTEGELLLVGEDMETAVTAPGNEHVYIVQRTASGFKYSNKIQAANVKRYEGHSFAAATEQVSYVGFDGASGSIVVNDETEYSLNIVFKHDKTIWSQRQHKKSQHYTTGGNNQTVAIEATQLEIAEAMVSQVNADPETSTLAVVGLFCDEAGTALGTGVGTGAFVNGSNVVTFSTAVDNATGNPILAVGNYFKVAAATTAPIYKIVSIDVPNETITLDRPYTEASAAAVGNTLMRQIPAATVAAAECGFSITGLAQTFNTLDFYEQVQFELALDGGFHISGSTSLAEFDAGESASPESGSGTYEKVFDLENKAQGYEGITNRVGFPIPAFPVYATAGNTYDVYVISHDDVHGSSSLNRDLASPMETIVAVNILGATTAQGSLETDLNAFFGASGLGFPDLSL